MRSPRAQRRPSATRRRRQRTNPRKGSPHLTGWSGFASTVLGARARGRVTCTRPLSTGHASSPNDKSSATIQYYTHGAVIAIAVGGGLWQKQPHTIASHALQIKRGIRETCSFIRAFLVRHSSSECQSVTNHHVRPCLSVRSQCLTKRTGTGSPSPACYSPLFPWLLRNPASQRKQRDRGDGLALALAISGGEGGNRGKREYAGPNRTDRSRGKRASWVQERIGGDAGGRDGAADADGAAGEAPVVAGQQCCGRRGGRRGLVEVGAVGVQGQGGADRAAQDGGPGEGVRAPRARRGGVQAPRFHQAGAGRHVRPDAEGGGVDTEADRHGEPSAQASQQDLRQKGEGIQGGPGGVQREEQRESAASQQANRAGKREREDAYEEARGAQQDSRLTLLDAS